MTTYNKSGDLSNMTVEYAVESDCFELSDYFKKILNNSLKNKFIDEIENEKTKNNEDLNKNSIKLPKVEISEKITEKKQGSEVVEDKMKDVIEKEEENKENDINLKECSIIESVYELVDNIDSDSSFLTNINSPFLRKSISAEEKNKKIIISAIKQKKKVNFALQMPTNQELTLENMENQHLEMKKSISDISFDFLSLHNTLCQEKKV